MGKSLHNESVKWLISCTMLPEKEGGGGGGENLCNGTLLFYISYVQSVSANILLIEPY